ncbi:MAG: PAS domain-containing protein [Verrucomicrobia bacterium]|nr:PAS domain-containing protein [Verrucomicrobiota bacterium]
MQPLQFLRNLPVKHKMMFVVMVTCGAILLLVCISLFSLQLFLFKQSAARDLVALAEVVASNIAGPVSFGDELAATEVLMALKSRPQVAAVGIRLPAGTRWVHLGAEDEFTPVGEPLAQASLFFRGRDCYVTQPIMLKGELVGVLDMHANFVETYRRLASSYALILAVVLAVSLIVAAILSTRLQRLISDPIQQLASVVRVVTEEKDYSVRARKFGNDEVGLLTEAFNDMLDQIQARDTALEKLSQRKFESLVNSIDGIVWERGAESIHFAFVSRQSERLLGYAPEEWMASPRFWQGKLHPEDAARAVRSFHEAVARRLPYHFEYRMIAADGRWLWFRESGVVLVEPDQRVTVRGIFQDITEQRMAVEELESLHNRLVEASRHAGMAEVATGVLHNVGNVLNSVNVSITLLRQNTISSNLGSLVKLGGLMKQHEADLTAFLTTDPKGKRVPDFIVLLADQLVAENKTVQAEQDQLARNIEHIMEIVAMQQNYAQISGILEHVSVAELLDHALQMNIASLSVHAVNVVRRFTDVPLATVDKHKVLQILVNLVQNAIHALGESDILDKELAVGLGMRGADRVQITVTDNGVGISPENLTRIFSHGFSTRKDGHGFGLHSGANAAKEMGGWLTAYSKGVGKGATFTLVLPLSSHANA